LEEWFCKSILTTFSISMLSICSRIHHTHNHFKWFVHEHTYPLQVQPCWLTYIHHPEGEQSSYLPGCMLPCCIWLSSSRKCWYCLQFTKMNPTTFSKWLRVSKTEIYGYFVTYQPNTTTSVWIPYLSQVTNWPWKEQAIPFKIQPAISCKWWSIHTKGLLVYLLFVRQVSLAQISLVHIRPQWGGNQGSSQHIGSSCRTNISTSKKGAPRDHL